MIIFLSDDSFYQIKSVILPVSDASIEIMEEEIGKIGASLAAILHMGRDGSSSMASLELCAKNIRPRSSHPIDPTKPTGWILPSTADLGSSKWHQLFAEGEPVRFSNDAGSYYCNQIYYKSLSYQLDIPVLFLHVPQRPISIDLIRKIIEKLLQ